jgi:hypothetical protein
MVKSVVRIISGRHKFSEVMRQLQTDPIPQIICKSLGIDARSRRHSSGIDELHIAPFIVNITTGTFID